MRSRGFAHPGPATPRGDREVIQKQEVFLIETLREDYKDKLLEILGAVRRAERQPARQIASTNTGNRHFFRSSRLIVALVEPFLEVPHGDEPRPSHAGLDFIAVWNQEHLSDRLLVERPVVYHHTPLALNSFMLWRITRWEGGRSPV